MIEINLLPEELRNRVVKIAKPEVVRSGTRLNLQQLILLIPVIFTLLIIVHLFFIVLGISYSAQLGSLKSKWDKSTNERKALEDFNAEHTLLSGDSLAVQQLVNERITWADKLNKISLALPPGVWLEAVFVSSKDFSLAGSVVSLKKEEIALLRQLSDNLKNDPDFFRDFNTLELGSIQKNMVGEYEVADFTLIGTLKGK